ncbi:MAG: hypothetical protein ABIJ40_03310 [Bacteroidota bacterium]
MNLEEQYKKEISEEARPGYQNYAGDNYHYDSYSKEYVKWLETKVNSIENPVILKIANKIYNNLIDDLTDRRGLKQAYWDIGADDRLEIKSKWINIIKSIINSTSGCFKIKGEVK